MIERGNGSNLVNLRDHRVPAVSVIIPAYRAAAYIGETLRSVLAQTFKDYEIVVVNDGSPDTVELERELEPYRDEIVYRTQSNLGPGAARNTGIRAARGRFVAFLDADDSWEPSFLEEQMAFVKAHPGTDLVYSDARIVGESDLAGRTFMETTPSIGEVTLQSLLNERCSIPLSSVVVRRQLVISAGMFDERFRLSEDYDLWLRLAGSGARMAYQRRALLRRRHHSERTAADASRLFASAMLVLDKTERTIKLVAEERAALLKRRNKLKAYIRLESGKRELARGRIAAAADAFEEANVFYRSWKLRCVLFSLRFAPGLLMRVYALARPVRVESKRA